MIRLSFISIILCIGMVAIAGTKKVDGYIITLTGDTLYGKIKIKTSRDGLPDYAKLQNEVVFYSYAGQRSMYTPGTIQSFYFYYDFQTPTFVSADFYKDSQLFLMVIGDQGALKLYKYYPSGDKGLSSAYELAEYVYGVYDFDERFFFYILKPNGQRLLLGKHTPQNKITEFFSDYTEIAGKLKSREYNYADVYKMVREYNQWKQDQLNGKQSSVDE